MNVLFLMRSTIYVRNFESTLRLLAQRGHRVHIVADAHQLNETNALVEKLCAECPGLSHVAAPAVPFDAWSFLGTELRRGVDYLRYLGPEFTDAAKLRARGERNAPGFVLRLAGGPLGGTAAARRLLARLLRWCDRAVPRNRTIDAFVGREAPDLVVVTPLVEPGAPQAEYLRSARAFGVPTALCVHSWDNLTNKGLIHDPLDLVTVWNPAMKEEAVTLHGVRPDRVVVTGAQSYDHWFEWTPRDSKADFCARAGLPSDAPYLLYLCSSKFIAPEEPVFVQRWAAALRTAAAPLSGVNVLVRPHPQNAEVWRDVAPSALAALGLAVWPRGGANPVEEDSRAGYFDSIYHSAAVVGVNTSAQIESAIVGRGVYTVLAPEFRDTQDGTLHFQHLRSVNGGLLHVANDFEQHHTQLAAALSVRDDDRCRRFVEAFVRPHGLDAAATPRLVEALESAGRARVPANRGPSWAWVVRPALARAAKRLAGSPRARVEKSARQKRVRAARQAEREARRAEARAVKQREAERRLARLDEAARVAEGERQATARLEADAYDRYLATREWALSWRDAAGDAQLADEERCRAARLAGLWDATPESIASLRHYGALLTGVRPQDYADGAEELETRTRRRLALLLKAARDLFVPEPDALGGFGFRSSHVEGAYNQDTIGFFETLIALRDGALLQAVRNPPSRRLVWEIGGGWGGFAHQFTTVCPDVTYVISGQLSELLLSAVYLGAVRPAARLRFVDRVSPGVVWDRWEDADFVFVPEAALAQSPPPRLDLVVDLGATASMTQDRARLHAQLGFERGVRFWYSLMPVRLQPERARAAAGALDRWFWLHPVPHRVDSGQTLREGDAAFVRDHAFDHMAGWRRLRV